MKMRMSLRFLLAALAVGLLVLGSATGAQAKKVKPAKPVIGSASASPEEVANEGTSTISGTVEGATECTVSAPKKLPVEGLPATVPCAAGTFSVPVTLPANKTYSAKAVKYKLVVSAVGGGGKSTAKVTVIESWHRYSLTPTAVVGIEDATQVAAGGHGCATLSTGGVECWGKNERGDLGTGHYGGPVDTPEAVVGLDDATEVATDSSTTCALRMGGHVDCWGSGLTLGNGTAQESDEPVEVAGVTEATQVSAGEQTACALLQSGHIVCWGFNESGQLGDGNRETALAPEEVEGVSNAVEVAVGSSTVCAVLATGHMDCWGYGESGTLGNGSLKDSYVPVEVLGITEARQAAVGIGTACATLSGGHVECWGIDSEGQIGNGSTKNYFDEPQEVTGLSEAAQVTVGADFACALATSGLRYCWGGNSYGQFGTGTKAGSTVPLQVSSDDEATQLSASGFDFCALLGSGGIECSGYNEEGELGNGSFV